MDGRQPLGWRVYSIVFSMIDEMNPPETSQPPFWRNFWRPWSHFFVVYVCSTYLHIILCLTIKGKKTIYLMLYSYSKLIYRRIVKTTQRCIKNSMLMIIVIFKILLNSIVCFLHISSSYFRVRGIIKVAIFSRF